MNSKLAGRVILSLVAVFTIVGPYLADWNETHIYNPYWPPHAKFHNAQTMVLGTLLGLAALGFLWWPRAQVLHLKVGALLSSLYWISQVPALFFPGTKGQFDFLESARRRYGDVYELDLGFTQATVLCHPRHAQYILLDNARNYTKGGPLWDSSRTLTSASATPT